MCRSNTESYYILRWGEEAITEEKVEGGAGKRGHLWPEEEITNRWNADIIEKSFITHLVAKRGSTNTACNLYRGESTGSGESLPKLIMAC